jgi:hypothetical protein
VCSGGNTGPNGMEESAGVAVPDAEACGADTAGARAAARAIAWCALGPAGPEPAKGLKPGAAGLAPEPEVGGEPEPLPALEAAAVVPADAL